MSVVTYEGRIERGQIKLKDAPALPEGAQVYLVVAAPEGPRGADWARELYSLFEPVRAEAAELSEADVNADIDAAVKAARGQRD